MTTQGKTPPPEPPEDVFYRQCLDNSARAQSGGKTASALMWLRRAEEIGTGIMKKSQLPEVTAGYVAIILRLCHSARDLSVESGNITLDHLAMSSSIQAAAHQLRCLLQRGDAELAAKAAHIEGLSLQVAQQVACFRKPDELYKYTPAAELDQLIDNLHALMANVSQLGVEVEEPYGPSLDLLDLARTAVDNAQELLSWFWSSKISDWDKALFMCRRAQQLLSQHVTLEGSAAGSHPELDRIFERLKAAEAYLAQHRYAESKTDLERAHQELTEFIANM